MTRLNNEGRCVTCELLPHDCICEFFSQARGDQAVEQEEVQLVNTMDPNLLSLLSKFANLHEGWWMTK